MCILMSMFVVSGSSLYSGFSIERIDCTIYSIGTLNHVNVWLHTYICSLEYLWHVRTFLLGFCLDFMLSVFHINEVWL